MNKKEIRNENGKCEYVVEVVPESGPLQDGQSVAEAGGLAHHVVVHRQRALFHAAHIFEDEPHTAVQHLDGRMLCSQVLCN